MCSFLSTELVLFLQFLATRCYYYHLNLNIKLFCFEQARESSVGEEASNVNTSRFGLSTGALFAPISCSRNAGQWLGPSRSALVYTFCEATLFVPLTYK